MKATHYGNWIKQIVDRLNRQDNISLQEEKQQLQTISETGELL